MTEIKWMSTRQRFTSVGRNEAERSTESGRKREMKEWWGREGERERERVCTDRFWRVFGGRTEPCQGKGLWIELFIFLKCEIIKDGRQLEKNFDLSSPFLTRCRYPCALLKIPQTELSYSFVKTNLFVRVQEYIRLLSDPRFGSFLRSEERDQISKRISRFVAIVIGVNKNIRESTFIDLFFFSKILENSNILDDWTIGQSLYFSFWISKKPIGTRRRFANLLTVLMKFSVEYFCTWRGSCIRYFVGIEESSQRSKIYRISFIQRSIQI